MKRVIEDFVCSSYYQLKLVYFQWKELNPLYVPTGIIVENDYVSLQKQIAEVQSMRSAQLRNILLQDYHIKHGIIDKMIDRQELKQLLVQILNEKQEKICTSVVTYFFTGLCGLLLLSILCYKYRQNLYQIFKYFLSFFIDKHLLKQKSKVLKLCSSNRKAYLGVFLMILSLLLEVLVAWIQASLLLSWIIPSHWYIRNFLFYGGLKLPLASTIGHLSSATMSSSTQKTSSVGQPSGGWDVDIGSIISLALYRKVISFLDNYSSGLYMKTLEEAHSQNEEDSPNPFQN
jgi:hypothetical protein